MAIYMEREQMFTTSCGGIDITPVLVISHTKRAVYVRSSVGGKSMRRRYTNDINYHKSRVEAANFLIEKTSNNTIELSKAIFNNHRDIDSLNKIIDGVGYAKKSGSA